MPALVGAVQLGAIAGDDDGVAAIVPMDIAEHSMRNGMGANERLVLMAK